MPNVISMLTGGIPNFIVVLGLLFKDYRGNVLHHAIDALTFSPNRLTAELRCLEWELESMKDLGYQEVVMVSDLHELTESVMKPSNWPSFRILL